MIDQFHSRGPDLGSQVKAAISRVHAEAHFKARTFNEILAPHTQPTFIFPNSESVGQQTGDFSF